MTASNRIRRALALATFGLVATGAAQAQSWDIDFCNPGNKNIIGGTSTGASTGYTSCAGTGTTATLDVKAYTSSAGGSFTATNINSQSGYIGVLSGSETSGSSSPHHAIDNYTSLGNSVELVHLNFSQAVNLGTLVATWANNQGSGGDADFQVYRWDYNSGAAPTITAYSPTVMTGWTLVKSGDFDSTPGSSTGSSWLSQTISDGTYFSSHWLVTTAFDGSNDAFKLGTISASAVCATSVTSTGGCAPSTSVPEPASLALVLLAGVSATAVRRRRRA